MSTIDTDVADEDLVLEKNIKLVNYHNIQPFIDSKSEVIVRQLIILLKKV